jgi:hypothetical protein
MSLRAQQYRRTVEISIRPISRQTLEPSARLLWVDSVAKVENQTTENFRQSGFLDASTATTLCGADAKVVVVFVRIDVVPHVAARETHQWSLEFSFFTRKRLFQHYRS